ncbi:hypothetical protein P7K49_005363 [Saguinus oedipus]|uniref:Uncharacterized protein n=1 Tax=Saguinus oedipus TaxID=9490 RepID=A0ABQ9WAW3_SAGOE|nr:hypothetical protein P7K49_005363 [Saguinus oedipus]
MAPRPLGPLVLALGGAAAVLGSVLFILWKTYFGRGRERRWDRDEAWWGAEAPRLPEWDEWDHHAVGLGCSSGGRSLEGAAPEHPRTRLGRLALLPHLRSAPCPGACREKPRPSRFQPGLRAWQRKRVREPEEFARGR